MPAVAKNLAKKKPSIALQKTRNPLSESQRVEVVRALQPIQSGSLELYLQVKNAHWNVRGTNFYALHNLFDEIANDVLEIADSLAERVAVLGAEPLATAQRLSAVPQLADVPFGMRAQEEFVKLITDRLAFYVQMLREAIDSCEKNSDFVSQDICIKAVGTLEKKLWITESHILNRM